MPVSHPRRSFGGGATLERRSIAEQVADRIMAMIKSGNLKAGDRLPTEQQMGIAFGISRPPLREALKALTLMGILAEPAGRALHRHRSLADPARGAVQRHAVDRRLRRARAFRGAHRRRARSSSACARERATPEQRQRILKLARDGRAFHDDPVAFRLIDIEFHQALNVYAGNGYLAALAQGLYDVALDVRRTASAVPGVIKTSVAQHCDVADAIMAHDGDAAVAAYRRHLEHVRDTTIQTMAATSQAS